MLSVNRAAILQPTLQFECGFNWATLKRQSSTKRPPERMRSKLRNSLHKPERFGLVFEMATRTPEDNTHNVGDEFSLQPVQVETHTHAHTGVWTTVCLIRGRLTECLKTGFCLVVFYMFPLTVKEGGFKSLTLLWSVFWPLSSSTALWMQTSPDWNISTTIRFISMRYCRHSCSSETYWLWCSSTRRSKFF